MKTMACKVCSGLSPEILRCDFHQNALFNHGLWASPINPSGKEVIYYQCGSCGFTFTDLCDRWTSEEFKSRIYNKDYPHIDNDYMGMRGASMANMLWHALHRDIDKLSFLDYGSGHGVQSHLLEEYGAKRSESYDPFTNPHRPKVQFDLVVCQEVLEHSTDPHGTAKDLMSFGDFLFCTTQLVPSGGVTKDWWYVSPRAGHVSFYTDGALKILFPGFHITHVGDGMHIIYKKWPQWASHLLPVSAK